MPVYNGAEYLEEAVESILRQTYSNFDFLIIDDASGDGTAGLLKKIAAGEKRTRIITNPVRKQLAAALNQGIESAGGKYIAMMNCDDISLPGRIERQVEFLKTHPDIDVCGTWYERFNGIKERVDLETEHEKIKTLLFRTCPVCHPSVMFRKEALERSGLRYCEEFNFAEDFEFWTRLVEKCHFANVPEVLLRYRIHANQTVVRYEQNHMAKVDAIRERQLRRLVSNPTDEQMLLHLELCRGGFRRQGENYFEDIRNWLELLRNSNKQKGIYPQDEFSQMLKDWEKQLAYSFYFVRKKYSPAVLLDFLRNKNKPWDKIRPIYLIKFAVKCLIAWTPFAGKRQLSERNKRRDKNAIND
ncbi:MAG: hypothetical protein A2Z83_05645 [Omnitrophica bacterium GWA2_52_8]|nr:MAG: hypothetical protein A2Z83_05645 [Omnitrophica bacterium GWA2_52_8]